MKKPFLTLRRAAAMFVFVLLALFVLCAAPGAMAEGTDGDLPPETVTVTFDLQGKGENCTNEIAYGTPWQYANFNVSIPVNQNGIPISDDGYYIFDCFSLEPMADSPTDQQVGEAMQRVENLVFTEDTTIYIVWMADFVDVGFNMECDEIPSFTVRIRRGDFINEEWIAQAFPNGYPTREGYTFMGFTPKPWTEYEEYQDFYDDVLLSRLGPPTITDGRYTTEAVYYVDWFENTAQTLTMPALTCGDVLDAYFMPTVEIEGEGGEIRWPQWNTLSPVTVKGGQTYEACFTYTPTLGCYAGEPEILGADDVRITREEYSASLVYTVSIRAAHSWNEPEWQWAEDYGSATAVFTCAGCTDRHTVTVDAPEETEITPADETTDRVVKYKAQVTVDGQTYTIETEAITLEGTAIGAPDDPDTPETPDTPDTPDTPAEEEPDEQKTGVAVLMEKLKAFFAAIRSFFLHLFGQQ